MSLLALCDRQQSCQLQRNRFRYKTAYKTLLGSLRTYTSLCLFLNPTHNQFTQQCQPGKRPSSSSMSKTTSFRPAEVLPFLKAGILCLTSGSSSKTNPGVKSGIWLLRHRCVSISRQQRNSKADVEDRTGIPGGMSRLHRHIPARSHTPRSGCLSPQRMSKWTCSSGQTTAYEIEQLLRSTIAKSLFILQVPGTKGAEIEEGVRERLKPWLNKGKLAIVRKVSALKPDLPYFY